MSYALIVYGGSIYYVALATDFVITRNYGRWVKPNMSICNKLCRHNMSGRLKLGRDAIRTPIRVYDNTEAPDPILSVIRGWVYQATCSHLDSECRISSQSRRRYHPCIRCSWGARLHSPHPKPQKLWPRTTHQNWDHCCTVEPPRRCEKSC